MGSLNAVLSTPRTLDMVPLGDDLQGGCDIFVYLRSAMLLTFRFRHSGFVSWLLKGVTTWRKKGHVALSSPHQLGRTMSSIKESSTSRSHQ